MSKKSVAAKTLQIAGTDREEKTHDKAARAVANIMRRSKDLLTIPEKLAGDKFAYRNWPVPDGETIFPLAWRSRFVALYYPFSPEGPLLVDMPVTEHGVQNCKAKSALLKERGHRYVYLPPQITESEARQQMEGQANVVDHEHS